MISKIYSRNSVGILRHPRRCIHRALSTVNDASKPVTKPPVKFNTPAADVVPGDKANEKVLAHRQYIQRQSSVTPKGNIEIAGNGKDLHIPEDITEIAVFSGVPAEHAKRKVLIEPRITKTTQSAERLSHQWQLSWQRSSGERHLDPLMGWSSTSDPMAQVLLYFDSREDAIAFAKRNGWNYEVDAPIKTPDWNELGNNKYAFNFLPNKITEKMNEEGPSAARKQFAVPTYGRSHFFMPLDYHGKKEVDQFGPKQTASVGGDIR